MLFHAAVLAVKVVPVVPTRYAQGLVSLLEANFQRVPNRLRQLSAVAAKKGQKPRKAKGTPMVMRKCL